MKAPKALKAAPSKLFAKVLLGFTKDSYERMLVLKEKVEAESVGEVARSALQLYEGLVEFTQEGRKLYTVDPVTHELKEYPLWK